MQEGLASGLPHILLHRFQLRTFPTVALPWQAVHASATDFRPVEAGAHYGLRTFALLEG